MSGTQTLTLLRGVVLESWYVLGAEEMMSAETGEANLTNDGHWPGWTVEEAKIGGLREVIERDWEIGEGGCRKGGSKGMEGKRGVASRRAVGRSQMRIEPSMAQVTRRGRFGWKSCISWQCKRRVKRGGRRREKTHCVQNALFVPFLVSDGK
jgi:hypothetical protein